MQRRRDRSAADRSVGFRVGDPAGRDEPFLLERRGDGALQDPGFQLQGGEIRVFGQQTGGKRSKSRHSVA